MFCSLLEFHQRLGGMYCLHLQVQISIRQHNTKLFSNYNIWFRWIDTITWWWSTRIETCSSNKNYVNLHLYCKPYCWLLGWLTLGFWRRRQKFTSKCRLTSTGLHGFTCHKIVLFNAPAMRTSDLTAWKLFENMQKLKFLGMTLTIQNYIHAEIKSRLNSRNSC
jgi:hypothetical protein